MVSWGTHRGIADILTLKSQIGSMVETKILFDSTHVWNFDCSPEGHLCVCFLNQQTTRFNEPTDMLWTTNTHIPPNEDFYILHQILNTILASYKMTTHYDPGVIKLILKIDPGEKTTSSEILNILTIHDQPLSSGLEFHVRNDQLISLLQSEFLHSLKIHKSSGIFTSRNLKWLKILLSVLGRKKYCRTFSMKAMLWGRQCRMKRLLSRATGTWSKATG